MSGQRRPPLLALSALLLCSLHQAAGSGASHGGNPASSSSSSSSSSSLSTTTTTTTTTTTSTASPSEVRAGEGLGQPQHTNYGSHSQDGGAIPKREEAWGHVYSSSLNTSRGDLTTVMSEGSGGSPDTGGSPLCAYRVTEGGIAGQLCFRRTLFGYKCHKGDCRTAVTSESLVANMLLNGSVLLQWRRHGGSAAAGPHVRSGEAAAALHPGANPTRAGTLKPVFSGQRRRRAGYELSCWWNGSYTQFECAGVHLGFGCRDFLLTELHENIPYRICLRSLAHHDPAHGADRRDCVEFILPPSGMQDIVIAMTTVGGAICVMLVIICLLVAYITENIMSPTTQHTYSYRTHSRH